MPAIGTITAASSLHPEPDPQTANNDILAHTGAAVIPAYTNSVMQIRIDADDGATTDDPEITVKLAKVGGSFTVTTSTDTITTSAPHGLEVNEEVKFTTSGVLPAGLALTGTFTADDATDLLTTSAPHGLKVGQEIRFSTTSALPEPLLAGVPYFVAEVNDPTEIKVSLLPGGPPIDIINAGTGTQTWVGTVTFYVQVVGTSTTFKVATKPGGSVQDISTTGSGTHSWQAYGSATVSYIYPLSGPAVPVTIKQNRDGKPDDFTQLRAVHVTLLPTDPDLAASGQACLIIGDVGGYHTGINVPLSFVYDPLLANQNAASVWTGSLPPGWLYDADSPLVVKIRCNVGNVNMSVLINILGN